MTPTIAQLDARAQVFRAHFPSCGVQMLARRALRHIYEVLDADPATVVVPDVLAMYQEVAGPCMGTRTSRDELSALRHLAGLPALAADVADRIWQCSAHLGDAAAVTRLQSTWGAESARIVGAIERFARLRGQDLEAIPAVERQVKAALEQLTAADFGIGQRSYPTLRSRILRAVRLVDRHAHSRVSADALSGPWRRLCGAVRPHQELRGDLAKLWSLITFCWSRGVAPKDVDDRVIRELLAHLEQQQVAAPFDRVRATIYAWERVQRAVGAWPQTKLSRLYAEGRGRVAPRITDLPPEVQGIWNRYAAAATRSNVTLLASELVCEEEHDDQLAGVEDDHLGGVLGGHYSQTTISQQRGFWLQCAAAFHEIHGRYPGSLADVATRDVLSRVMTAISQRQKAQCAVAGNTYNEKSPYKKNLANAALAWARFEGADDRRIQVLENIRDRVDQHLIARQTDATGKIRRTYTDRRMGERHRRRLAQFRNPLNVLAWYRSPEHLLELARSRLVHRPSDAEAINLACVALLHRILRCAPLRRSNLAGLRIGGPKPQIALPVAGRGAGRIEIDWLEVKNRRDLTVELDSRTVELLRWWIGELRPRLMCMVGADPENPHLFPAAGMEHRAKDLLNARFVQVNRRHAGLTLNLHLCRHLTAKIILDQDPTQIELVQQLLGHRRRATTESYYAEINDLLAQRRWHEILAQAMRATAGAAKRRG